MKQKVFLLLVFAAIAGCGRNRLPDDPEQLILYSIDGTELQKEPHERKKHDGEILYDCPVLGKVDVSDVELRREVISAVRADMESKQSQAACFIPRHAIRIVKNGKTIEVVICYECHRCDTYRDEQRQSGNRATIGTSSEALLNKILTDAGVPLAPK